MPTAVQLHCRVGAARSAGSLPKAIPGRLCERLAALSLQRQVLCHWFVDDARWLSLSFLSGSVSALAFSSSVQRRAFLQSVALSKALLSHQQPGFLFPSPSSARAPHFGPQTAAVFGVQFSEPNG